MGKKSKRKTRAFGTAAGKATLLDGPDPTAPRAPRIEGRNYRQPTTPPLRIRPTSSRGQAQNQSTPRGYSDNIESR